MTRFLALLSLVASMAATGCAGYAHAVGADRPKPLTRAERRSQAETSAKAANAAYIDCALSHAGQLARSDGTPSDIADAAHGECLTEFTAYSQAARAFFIASISGPNRGYAIDQADNSVQNTRSNTRDAIIGRILRARGR